MSHFNRIVDRVIDAAPTIREYVRVTFDRLWWFGVAAIAAGVYGALCGWAFALNGWPSALGANLAFWPASVILWVMVIGSIRHTVRTGM
jgi:hypothetical protein